MKQDSIVSIAELVTIRPETEIISKQGLPNFVGISQESPGATGLCMHTNVPHRPINLSDSEPARALIARNDPNEQESVLLYPDETGA